MESLDAQLDEAKIATGRVRSVKEFADSQWARDWHTHNCAHGMYVLDGILKTHAGSFGPGSFVWFPEGLEMEHGRAVGLHVHNCPVVGSILEGSAVYQIEGQPARGGRWS